MLKELKEEEKIRYIEQKEKLIKVLDQLRPGAVYPVTWFQDKMIEGLGEFRVIRTHTRIRLNASYTNRKDVAKSTGTTALRYGEWVKGQENKILEHHDRYYLRLNFKTGLKGEDRVFKKYQQKLEDKWVDVDFTTMSSEDANKIQQSLESSVDKVGNLMIIKIIKISKYTL